MSKFLPRKQLPVRPSIEHLQKQAKRLVKQTPGLTLAQAQQQLSREYGCKNWTDLRSLVESTRRGDAQFSEIYQDEIKSALLRQDASELRRLLDEHPHLMTPALWPIAIFQAKSLEMTQILLDRGLSPDECSAPRKPLHLAVYQCLPDIVELLIARGADANLRNPLDETPIELLDAYEPRPVGDPDTRRIRLALGQAGAHEDFYTLIRAGESFRVREMLAAEPALARSDSSLGGPLFTAARSGRPEIVSLLLEFGSDLNKTNDKGNTPLWFAAQSPAQPASNRIAVMKLLLDAGAEINRRCEDGSTALHFAAWRGPVEVVSYLVNQGASNAIPDDQGKTPLDFAREHSSAPDKESIVNFLSQFPIREAMTTDPAAQILAATLENDLPSLQILLDRYPEKITLTGGPWNKPLLHCAAWAGHLVIVRELLNRGFNPNLRCESDHASALHFAAERGHLEIVQLLIEAGTDLEAPDNDHQLNVLGWATSLGKCQETIARFLTSRGARMTIWSAVALNDATSVRLLILDDPSLLSAQMSRNEYHRTPLHHAVERNRPEMVELLLELGADPSAMDSMNLGPIGAGNSSTDSAILTLLGKSNRSPNLHDALVLGHFAEAEELWALDRTCLAPGGKETRLFVYAIVRKNWSMAEWLLEHGCDINAVAEVYQCPATALHFLIEQGNIDRVKWLLEQGADTHIPDGKYQADALNWAEFFGHSELEELIRKHRQNQPARASKSPI